MAPFNSSITPPPPSGFCLNQLSPFPAATPVDSRVPSHRVRILQSAKEQFLFFLPLSLHFRRRSTDPVVSLHSESEKTYHVDSTLSGAMVDIVGRYELVSSENFEKFLETLGVNFAIRTVALVLKPSTVVCVDGDEYRIKTISTFKTSEIKFKLGEPFEEETMDGRQSTSVVTMDTETRMKHVQKSTGKELVILRDFSAGQMIVTLSIDGVSSKRVYKKAS